MEKFTTQDIVLAAVLKMVGNELTDITIEKHRIGNFTFANVSEDFLRDYQLGKTRVEPISFNNNLKQLVTAVRQSMDRS